MKKILVLLLLPVSVFAKGGFLSISGGGANSNGPLIDGRKNISESSHRQFVANWPVVGN